MMGMWRFQNDRNLPDDVTELELVTVAFAALNGAMYFFWWDKPLDVQYSVPVFKLPGPWNPRVLEESATSAPLNITPPQVKCFLDAVTYPDHAHGHDVCSNSLRVATHYAMHQFGSNSQDAILVTFLGTVFAAIHCVAWHSSTFEYSRLERSQDWIGH